LLWVYLNSMKRLYSLLLYIKKPKDEVFNKIKEYIQEKLSFLEKTYVHPRKLEFQAKTVKEGSATVYWITTEMPVVTVKGVIESAEYSSLKVKNQTPPSPSQKKWIDAFLLLLKEILNLVTVNFPTGLLWLGKEESDFSFLYDSGAPVITSKPDVQKEEKKKEEAPVKPTAPIGGGMMDLFAQLSKGEGITSGLKHVDKKKKDPSETEQRPLEHKVLQPKTVKPTEIVSTKPPKKAKIDFNWFVENFVNDQTIVIEEEAASIKEMIKIENCQNCSITINAKVKGITINRCKKLFVAFVNVVSNVEVIHSKSVEVYAKGTVPSILIDSSESIKVTLSTDLTTSIVSSKVTELNVTRLNSEGEYEKDFPVTEQFETKFDPEKNTFVTKPMNLFL